MQAKDVRQGTVLGLTFSIIFESSSIVRMTREAAQVLSTMRA